MSLLMQAMNLGAETSSSSPPASGSTPQMQAAIASQTDARSGFEQGWDSTLDFVESPSVQYSIMGTGAAAAMVNAGIGAAGCASASAGSIALASGSALIPLAAGVAAGFVGNWAGGHIGDWVGDAMGLAPLSGPTEKPAVVGDKIYHKPSGLIAGLMGAAVVLGAVAAIGAAAVLTAATGGAAAPLLVATTAFVAGGLVGGTLFGAANSLGQQGEEKGEIREGSPDVFFENKPVAHVSAFIDCRDHGPDKQCAEGSDTVYVNGFPLSRQGHKTTCDGVIQTGRETVALDLTTSADRLDIDGGWLNRIARTGLALSDLLPFPRSRKPRPGDAPPPQPRPRDPSTPPRFPRLSAAADGINNAFRRMVGDPVDVATGQVGEFRTDISIPGTIPLTLTRSYRRGATGIQGNDWSGSWAQHLRIENGAVIWQDPDGVSFLFDTPQEEVWSVNLRCPHVVLMGSRGGQMYIFDYRTQLFTLFRHRIGNRLLLSEIQDRSGNSIRFDYGDEGLRSVLHSDGFGLAVDSRGMVIRHATLTGRDVPDCVFSWQYDEGKRLTRVDSAQNGTLHYGYDSLGRLNMWADTHLTRAHFEYDRADRVIRNWSDSGHLSVELAYDDAAHRTRVTDAAGATRFFDWDDRGLVWRELDAAGGAWLTEWGPGCEIVARQNPLGNRWTYEHDGTGNLVSATDPEGHTDRWEYDANRLPVAHIDATGARTEYRRDGQGMVMAVTDPMGAQRMYRRDAQGQIVRVELPGQRQSRIYYDTLHRPSRIETPSGRTIRLVHDTEGRVIRKIDEIGAETVMDYTRGPQNPRGAMTRVVLPDGTEIDARYDSEGRLTSASNGLGEARVFRSGAFDLPLETQDPQGNRVRLEHDHALNLTAVINENGQRYQLGYDLKGNLVSESDYSGLVTRYDYDAADRLVRRIAPDGTETLYEWSPAGRPTRVVAGGIETLSEFDPTGRLLRVTNGTSTVIHAYDRAGRRISETVDGRCISFDYAPGSMDPIRRGGEGLGIELDYGADGDVSAMRFAATEMRFERDARGLELLRQTDAGFVHEQGWDVMGRLTGQLVGPELARGRPAAARVHRGYAWDGAGRAVQITDEAAGLTRIGYDTRGLVTDTMQQRPGGATPILNRYDYDPSRNLAALIEDMRADRVEDHAGRVRRRGRFFYLHDGCGRVIEKRHEEPGFRPRIWRMEWDAHDRLIRLVAPDGTIWRYDYDALGRRVRRLRVLEGGKRASRLRAADDWSLPADDGPESAPPPEPEGDPALRRMGSAYQWDGNRIAAEAPIYADGTTGWDRAEHWIYEPGTFRPMARVHDGEIAHVVTDHMGTPRELISGDGKRVLWRAELTLWGRLDRVEQAANDNEAPTHCPIRFQGQWEDAESGLYYNHHRYYDPDATQYLSPDPIGLLGGIRPQGYVADPNGWVDPLGLAACAFVDSDGILNLKNKYADPAHPDYHQGRADEFDAFVKLWDEQARNTPGGFTRQRVHGTPLNRTANNFRRRARRWLDAHGLSHLAPGHLPDTGWGGRADPGDAWLPLDVDVNQYIGGLTQGVPVGTNYTGVTSY